MVKVLTSGFYTSIQDLGRIGYANIGVPRSGAMDLYSAKLANHLLQNNEGEAVLEVTFGGCKLEFQSDCFICVTGADFSVMIDNELVSLNTVAEIKKGSILSFGKRKFGARTYIAISGGFRTEKRLESKSFYKGITEQSIIKRDDFLLVDFKQKIKTNTFSSIKINKNYFKTNILHCYKGPEFELLSEAQIKQLKNIEFSISSDNNRMGYRLNEIIENNFSSMLTSAVLPGTVQLTPSGKLIILMRDCQVTGGYPRVLQLTESATNKLAQKTTGDIFQFVVK